MKIAATLAGALFAIGLASPAVASTPDAVHEVFANVADGPAPAADGITNYGGPTQSTVPYVRDGYLTTTDPDAAVGGSYRIAELASDVTRVGASFAFTPFTVKDGALCLSIQGTSIAEGEPVPTSPVHLVVTPFGWSLDVNTEAGTGVEVFTGGKFATPLTTDGATQYRVEVELDRAHDTVRLSLPDGTVRTFAHEAFGQAGRFVYVEPFKSALAGPAADQTDALVSEWWATSEPMQLAADAVEPTPAAPVAEAPVVVQPAVVAVALTAPAGVKAVRKGGRVVVRWQAVDAAESYRVRCGMTAKVVDGHRAVVRSSAKACKVRAFGAGSSSGWAKAQVR